MPWRAGLAILAALACGAGAAASGRGADPALIVASTTSAEHSGLFRYLLPLFEAQTGIRVRVVAKGTGQAIKIARNGDADILLVHHRPSEERFVAEGYGVARHELMVNDFIIVGPAGDPGGIRGLTAGGEAFRRIAAAGARFASRGDDSGTHKAELAIWRGIDIDLAAASRTWYRSTGSGMGATLNTASAMNAYALADRATWAGFRNKGALVLLVAGDPRLRNQYSVILVNPAKHPHVKARNGQTFINWARLARRATRDRCLSHRRRAGVHPQRPP